MKQLVLVAGAALLFCSSSFAGFSIEGSPTVSSDTPSMGKFKPYDARGQASFEHDGPGVEPKQARYNNAALMVDLAYSSVTQTGTGPAPLIDVFADEIPFDDGMRMVLPAGWQLYRKDSMKVSDVPDEITFHGRAAWPDALKRIGDRYGLAFHIDWYQHTVMLQKGRPNDAMAQSARIRVIPEPAKQKAVATASLSGMKVPVNSLMPTRSGAAVASPAPTTKPISVATSNKNSTSSKTWVPVAPASVKAASAKTNDGLSATEATKPSSVTKAGAPKPVVSTASVAAKVSDTAKVDAKPVAPAAARKPVEFTMYVLPGTLNENVIRLSKENGWNPPKWDIDGDYKIASGFTLTASAFPQAMAKLLMLHPIEADVNIAQHKVIVLKEIK